MSEYPEFEAMKEQARRDAAMIERPALTDEQREEWERWVESRPPAIADLCRRFPPMRLYWLEPPGQVVFVGSYDEEEGGGVSMKVGVLTKYNPHAIFDRTVFGIKAEDLHEL